MAEERVADSDREPQAEQASAAAPKKKKKRERSKLGLLFLFLLLALGVAVGLHFSGVWDGRPLFWSVVPRIPYVGPSLAQILDVPERYSLTAEERRQLELEEWQRRLDERERGILSTKAGLEVLSDDLGRRAVALDEQERLHPAKEGPVSLEYFAHSSFRITSPQGLTVVIDPWRNDP